MTVRWWRYAQSLTERPMKGMLTGPVTILQWSFVRDDQPRQETCTQIALAIRDEVRDLEAAGIVRDPDRRGRRCARACRCAAPSGPTICAGPSTAFRLSVAPARLRHANPHAHVLLGVQRHHGAHRRVGRRRISIEASRSNMELLDAFAGDFKYPNEIGPGVYDIHSPRVPSEGEIERLLELAEQRIARERLWVNPDCGLKTRRWEDVLPALGHMVAAAQRRRASTPTRV